ncbi:MAG: hypothetical protein ACI4SE_07670 [Lachnospiraceae bacterium]
MANRIQWDPVVVYEELNQIEGSKDKMDGVETISYDLSEGMAIMDKVVASQKHAQGMIESYSKVIESDLMCIRAILEEVIERDNSIMDGL